MAARCDYQCTHCGHAFAQRVSTNPGPGLVACPRCDRTTAVRQLDPLRPRRPIFRG